MASYVIANYNVTNPDGYQQYLAVVVPTIVGHGGKILVAGPGATPKEGNPGGVTIVLEFPTREALEGLINRMGKINQCHPRILAQWHWRCAGMILLTLKAHRIIATANDCGDNADLLAIAF